MLSSAYRDRVEKTKLKFELEEIISGKMLSDILICPDSSMILIEGSFEFFTGFSEPMKDKEGHLRCIGDPTILDPRTRYYTTFQPYEGYVEAPHKYYSRIRLAPAGLSSNSENYDRYMDKGIIVNPLFGINIENGKPSATLLESEFDSLRDNNYAQTGLIPGTFYHIRH